MPTCGGARAIGRIARSVAARRPRENAQRTASLTAPGEAEMVPGPALLRAPLAPEGDDMRPRARTRIAPRPRRWFCSGSAALALLLLGMPSVATSQAAPLDQSFTSPFNLGADINNCCRYVAQTFTAGVSGDLTGVNVAVQDPQPDLQPKLRVEIRTVANDVPTTTVLGAVALDTDSVPITQLITLPAPVRVIAGTKYAIVLSYDGAPDPGPDQTQGVWTGAGGNLYPSGGLYFSPDDGTTWQAFPDADVHFQTYVQPLPTHPDQCKRGGWRSFSGIFTNQGQCVASLSRGPRR